MDKFSNQIKIAICLYGYYNNKVDPHAGKKGYKYIIDHVVKNCPNCSIDFFLHSWDVNQSDSIISQYNPKKHLLEYQIDFNKLANEFNIDESEINSGFCRDETIYKNCTIQNSLSFYYSRAQSIKLAIEFSHNNNFRYDSMIVCRFDIGHRSTWHLGYNVSLMEFNPQMDMNYIYSAMWKQLNAGYADQWFFSNEVNIEKLGKMYEFALNDYFQANSDYFKAITTGWPDSNSEDECSNEILRNDKSVNLIKYPKWQMINNHLLHKWHFINTGLYANSKFIGDLNTYERVTWKDKTQSIIRTSGLLNKIKSRILYLLVELRFMNNWFKKNAFEKNRYTSMQKKQYIAGTSNHEEHNNNKDYWDILLSDLKEKKKWKGKVALDFACGKGRNVTNMLNLCDFERVDGVDISIGNITFNRKNYADQKSNWYCNNGVDVSDLKSNEYDFIMSTIALQHIPVYDIRKSLLVDLFRTLKPLGIFTFQMGYGRGLDSPLGPRVEYFTNYYSAKGTNSICDVRVQDENEIISDLSSIGFVNIKTLVKDSYSDQGHPNWIYIKCQKPN